MSTILENPADQLSTIVVKFFHLAGDTRIEPQKRDEIFISAHKLHAYSMALAQKQFTENTESYKKAMVEITKVNNGLKQADADIEKIVETVKNISQLVNAVENIIIAVGGAVA